MEDREGDDFVQKASMIPYPISLNWAMCPLDERRHAPGVPSNHEPIRTLGRWVQDFHSHIIFTDQAGNPSVAFSAAQASAIVPATSVHIHSGVAW